MIRAVADDLELLLSLIDSCIWLKTLVNVSAVSEDLAVEMITRKVVRSAEGRWWRAMWAKRSLLRCTPELAIS